MQSYEFAKASAPLFESIEIGELVWRGDDTWRPGRDEASVRRARERKARNFKFEPEPSEGLRLSLAQAITDAGLAQAVLLDPSDAERVSHRSHVLSGEILKFSTDLKDRGFQTTFAVFIPIMWVLVVPMMVWASLPVFTLENAIQVRIRFENSASEEIVLERTYDVSEQTKTHHWRPHGRVESRFQALMRVLLRQIVEDLAETGKGRLRAFSCCRQQG